MLARRHCRRSPQEIKGYLWYDGRCGLRIFPVQRAFSRTLVTLAIRRMDRKRLVIEVGAIGTFGIIGSWPREIAFIFMRSPQREIDAFVMKYPASVFRRHQQSPGGDVKAHKPKKVRCEH
jgi:hypothetical protein